MKEVQAVLLHGDPGLGIWEALAADAAALLCEAPEPASRSPAGVERRACGSCAGCRLIAAGTHPDLRLVLPPALAIELGVATAEEGESGRKPSREIAIDDVRALVDWAHATSHRGGVRVALVYPLDAMAAPAANSLLKTLEEPPPGLQFLLGAQRLDRVLPTTRSRCRMAAMPRPGRADAVAALRQRGIDDSVADWCRGAVHGTDPAAGLDWARATLRGLAAGQAPTSGAGSLGQTVAALQRIEVDLMRVCHGLDPLYLVAERAELARLAAKPSTTALLGQWRRLLDQAATANFPLHAVALDSCVLEFADMFQPRAG